MDSFVDLVIDTNVLEHAANPQEQRQGPALKLLEEFSSSSLALCVDEVCPIEGPECTGLIIAEYAQRLGPMSIGRSFLAKMSASGRLGEPTARSLDPNARKLINQLVSNKRDRTFARTAYQSTSQHLVSHDFRDFCTKTRDTFSKKLAVKVVESSEVVGS